VGVSNLVVVDPDRQVVRREPVGLQDHLVVGSWRTRAAHDQVVPAELDLVGDLHADDGLGREARQLGTLGLGLAQAPPVVAGRQLLPLLRDEKRAMISKRKNPWARLTWFRERGYLPEALVNFLALQGYPPVVEPDGTEREVFTFAEFTERFRWADVNRAGAIFNLDKLDWLNGIYLRALTPDDLATRLLPHLVVDGVLAEPVSDDDRSRLVRLAELVGTRIVVLADATSLVRPFFVADDALEIAEDARAQLGDGAAEVLDAALFALTDLSERGEWSTEAIESALRSSLVEGLGIKARHAFGPLRTAVSGQRISPPLFESMEILGADSTLERLRALRVTL
jgi:glutamyl-tRNA synthetase